MKNPREDTEDIWRKAVDHCLAVNHIGTTDGCKTVHDALEKIKALVAFEQQIATDPKVSGGPAQEGQLNIFPMNGEYHIELYIGVQSFWFAYANKDYYAAYWYAEGIAEAIARTGGQVRAYEHNAP